MKLATFFSSYEQNLHQKNVALSPVTCVPLRQRLLAEREVDELARGARTSRYTAPTAARAGAASPPASAPIASPGRHIAGNPLDPARGR